MEKMPCLEIIGLFKESIRGDMTSSIWEERAGHILLSNYTTADPMLGAGGWEQWHGRHKTSVCRELTV